MRVRCRTGWETRGEASYYYTAERTGGRVVKQYVGSGTVAELAALLHAENRIGKAAARKDAVCVP
jgi:hypothetical protein